MAVKCLWKKIISQFAVEAELRLAWNYFYFQSSLVYMTDNAANPWHNSSSIHRSIHWYFSLSIEFKCLQNIQDLFTIY